MRSFKSKEQDVNYFFLMSSPVLQDPWCLRKHERNWFTIILGKLPVEFWGQEMKKKKFSTHPRTFHTTCRINKQVPRRKPKLLFLYWEALWIAFGKHTDDGAAQVTLVVKNPPTNAGGMRHKFDSWVRKIPWRTVWQPTPVFFPGDQVDRGAYSPWGRKEPDPTDVT